MAISAFTERSESVPPYSSGIPPLENGDHLTRAEFERRYNAMPQLKKAELIEGVVYVSSAVRADYHGEPHADVMYWLGSYRAATRGVLGADNTTLLLDLDNEAQPDAALWIDAARGGRCRMNATGYLEGPPELIVEVAATSASYDLHEKLRVYRRNGVREYIVWRVLNGVVNWLILREGEYLPHEPDAEGVIRSEVFPGLWLAVPALIAGDVETLQAKLQEGLATPDHAAFVKRLGEAGGS